MGWKVDGHRGRLAGHTCARSWSKMLIDEGNTLDHSVVLVLSQLRSRLPFVNEMEGNYLILCVFTLKMLLILGINRLFFK